MTAAPASTSAGVHQVLVTASLGDAVTGSALAVRDLLREAGPSEIFARYIDPRLEGEVKPLASCPPPATGKRRGVLVFHASIGEPEVFEFLTRRPEKLVLVYHNISPPGAFRRFDPAFAALLEEGRSALGALRRKVVRALAVSEYNAQDLRTLGYDEVHVSPLILDLDWVNDAGSREDIPGWTPPGPRVLFVGQMLPHKRPDLLLEAYHVLVTYLMPEAELVLVGAPRLERYRLALQRFIEDLNLHRAAMIGHVTTAELAAHFRRADLFVTLSEHEGFCIPLVEAMAFGVPVLARACAAIPETLGGAGVLLPPDAGAVLVAEAMAGIIESPPLRRQMIAAGRRRLAAFDAGAARARMLENLLAVL